MVDPAAAFERLKSLVPTGDSAWRYLAPRSTGAVASGLIIALGSAVLRRLVRSRPFGPPGWLAGAAVPLGLWALRRRFGPAANGRDDEAGETETREAREV